MSTTRWRDQPVDDLGLPIRGEHETWQAYHRRWWFVWSKGAAQQRANTGYTMKGVLRRDQNKIDKRRRR